MPVHTELFSLENSYVLISLSKLETEPFQNDAFQKRFTLEIVFESLHFHQCFRRFSTVWMISLVRKRSRVVEAQPSSRHYKLSHLASMEYMSKCCQFNYNSRLIEVAKHTIQHLINTLIMLSVKIQVLPYLIMSDHS